MVAAPVGAQRTVVVCFHCWPGCRTHPWDYEVTVWFVAHSEYSWNPLEGVSYEQALTASHGHNTPEAVAVLSSPAKAGSLA